MSCKLYISGPIKGLDESQARTNFLDAVLLLTRRGYETVNPFDCEPSCLATCEGGEEHVDCFMRGDIAEMVKCDGVALLDEWQPSRGVRIEYAIAVLLDMPVAPFRDWPVMAS